MSKRLLDIQLATPTFELIDMYASQFDNDQNYTMPDQHLRELFETFPENTTLSQIVWKVCAIDSLCSTQFGRVGNVAPLRMARHILGKNVDRGLQSGDSQVVHEIETGLNRKDYSFATKYCSWHRPDEYPIYDDNVGKILWKYQQQDQFGNFCKNELRIFHRYKSIHQSFKTHYNLNTCPPRMLDKFLLLYGKEILKT